MVVVHVHVRVKPEFVQEFIAATLINARASVKEPAIARFDFIQRQDDATRFVLTEVYRTPDGQAAHRATSHYATWRDAVEPMMAEPRASGKFSPLFPDEHGW